MKSVRLGSSGLSVSRLALGCMTYGDHPTRPWALDEAASRPFFEQALAAGITLFDTADVYGLGRSEEVTGAALKAMVPREHVLIATKLFYPMSDNPLDQGLSRRRIIAACDASLKRLGTDFIDLYQIHRFDPAVPPEETLEALSRLVEAGKVRYLGASSMFAWQFMKLLSLSEQHGWAKFISMQNHYNLLYREEEREMLPLCQAEGIGVLPWSPLARGRLTRTRHDSVRAKTDALQKRWYKANDQEAAIVAAVATVAQRHGRPMAQVALAWLLAKPWVSAPIIGASKPEHVDDAVAALTLTLSDEDIAALEAPYAPLPIAGHGYDKPY
jgi:1-deoxyxylulose-5-phosphate synthase